MIATVVQFGYPNLRCSLAPPSLFQSSLCLYQKYIKETYFTSVHRLTFQLSIPGLPYLFTTGNQTFVLEEIHIFSEGTIDCHPYLFLLLIFGRYVSVRIKANWNLRTGSPQFFLQGSKKDPY
jgi:hypothetical protein